MIKLDILSQPVNYQQILQQNERTTKGGCISLTLILIYISILTFIIYNYFQNPIPNISMILQPSTEPISSKFSQKIPQITIKLYDDFGIQQNTSFQQFRENVFIQVYTNNIYNDSGNYDQKWLNLTQLSDGVITIEQDFDIVRGKGIDQRLHIFLSCISINGICTQESLDYIQNITFQITISLYQINQYYPNLQISSSPENNVTHRLFLINQTDWLLHLELEQTQIQINDGILIRTSQDPKYIITKQQIIQDELISWMMLSQKDGNAIFNSNAEITISQAEYQQKIIIDYPQILNVLAQLSIIMTIHGTVYKIYGLIKNRKDFKEKISEAVDNQVDYEKIIEEQLKMKEDQFEKMSIQSSNSSQLSSFIGNSKKQVKYYKKQGKILGNLLKRKIIQQSCNEIMQFRINCHVYKAIKGIQQDERIDANEFLNFCQQQKQQFDEENLENDEIEIASSQKESHENQQIDDIN